MFYQRPTCALALATVLLLAVAARADEPKYPNWKGEWNQIFPRVGGQQVRFDPSKPFGKGQQAPLTPEYQKVLEASLADQILGGQGNFAEHARCFPPGMPTVMAAGFRNTSSRRRRLTFRSAPSCAASSRTGVRGRPISSRPSTATRSANGSTKIAMASTTCWKSKPAARSRGRAPMMRADCRCTSTTSRRSRNGFFIDKEGLLHNVITVFDHALTRPWTADKVLRRSNRKYPDWNRTSCVEGNNYLFIGTEFYYLSGDGMLMPLKKNQAPPDLRYFKQTKN